LHNLLRHLNIATCCISSFLLHRHDCFKQKFVICQASVDVLRITPYLWILQSYLSKSPSRYSRCRWFSTPILDDL
jgi:hypothetical protein